MGPMLVLSGARASGRARQGDSKEEIHYDDENVEDSADWEKDEEDEDETTKAETRRTMKMRRGGEGSRRKREGLG